MEKRTCTVPGCGRQHEARGWCKPHHKRWLATGDVRADLPIGARIETDEISKFWSSVEKTPTCWIWTGSVDTKGYGRFKLHGKFFQAHRWAYQRFVGLVPDGLQIDHVKAKGCASRLCVNFEEHLEPVTCRENIHRGARTKLSDDDVALAYALCGTGLTKREVADRFGVHPATLTYRFKQLTT
ncbi:HNH endonuclease [Streptomyces sp. NPDC003299]